ncbi:hypothetical protein [Parapedobacter sp. DT-150]|uniref:hypothetical protein n=1 Tax=Parapedobacter sp. DT-150 TaxID=3396162 RepID=UPI003F1DA67A
MHRLQAALLPYPLNPTVYRLPIMRGANYRLFIQLLLRFPVKPLSPEIPAFALLKSDMEKRVNVRKLDMGSPLSLTDPVRDSIDIITTDYMIWCCSILWANPCYARTEKSGADIHWI